MGNIGDYSDINKTIQTSAFMYVLKGQCGTSEENATYAIMTKHLKDFLDLSTGELKFGRGGRSTPDLCTVVTLYYNFTLRYCCNNWELYTQQYVIGRVHLVLTQLYTRERATESGRTDMVIGKEKL